MSAGTSPNAPANPWPRRTAYATALLTIPLVLLGGTVTTLRVGMAVPDWPTTFGENMLTYSLAEMMKQGGVAWEHSHRLAGAAIGFAAIAMVVAHVLYERRAFVRNLSIAALVAISLQGLLGGLRVVHNDTQLAFVHGSVAQAVFALVAAVAVLHTPAWLAAEPRACKRTVRLRRATLITSAVVYAQIVLGAWLRHSGHPAALVAHLCTGVAAAGTVVWTARELKLAAAAGDAGGHDRSALRRLAWRLNAVLGAQILLGVLTYVWVYLVTGPHKPVSIGEAIFATAHVAVGALLLVLSIASAMWARHVVTCASSAAPSARAATGGAS